MKTLDITDFKKHGMELAEEINSAVWSTQRLIIQPLPDEIVMTQSQFNELSKLSGMDEMYGTEGHIWYTRHNVMEVVVRDGQ